METPKPPQDTVLSKDTLALLATGETTLRHVNHSRPRDAVQAYFDNLVTQAYGKWVDAGRPTARRERPAMRIDAPTEELAEAARRRIRSSALHLGVGVAFDPIAQIARDKWRIAFSVQDRKARPRRSER